MNQNILTYLNQIEGYKTAIKSLHWDAKNMSEHKLWDDIADSVAEIQDNVSEMAQGIDKQIPLNTLAPTHYHVSSKEQILKDILADTKTLHKALGESEEYIGIRSELESFIGEINKYNYLLKIAIKENKIKQVVNETINRYINTNLLRCKN